MSYIALIAVLLVATAAVRYVPMDNRYLRLLLLVLPLVLLPFAFIGDIWLLVPIILLALSHGRLLPRRYGAKRERRILLRTNLYVLATVLAVGFVMLAGTNLYEWIAAAFGLFFVAIAARAFSLSILRTSRQTANMPAGIRYPTVTLAIPARNETHALTDTLRSALASDYPKLEILVLDDCSHDSTPDIIRSFAHDGVRFIQGTQPDSGWIGKNRAYEQLLEEASGELVLFAGVDVRMQPGSVRQLVHLFYAKRLSMLSVMPTRRHFDFWPNLLRPLRYYWQLAFAIHPVISSCWLVDREWLLNQQGFAKIKHEIRPEHLLASQALGHKAYAFVVASGPAAISTRKRLGSLYETAVRTIYPIHKKEPLLVFLSAFLLLGTLAAGALVWFLPPTMLVMLLRFATPLLFVSYVISELTLQGVRGMLSGLLVPFAILSEVTASLISMVRYEMGLVDWKGRNVCIPVMHQRPRERG